VHSKSKDCNSKKNTGSIVPTTASFQRTISRLHITGNGKFVGDNFPSDFLMLVVLNPSVILTINVFVFGVVPVPHRCTSVMYPVCGISA
jgi:hypothetical protein